MKLGDIFSQKAVLENKLRNMEENLRALEIAYKRELEANYRLAQKIAAPTPLLIDAKDIKITTVFPDTSDARECSRGRDKKIKTLKRKFKRLIEAERAMHRAAYALLDQKFSEHLDSLRVGVDIGSPVTDVTAQEMRFVNGAGKTLWSMPVGVDEKLPADIIKLVSMGPIPSKVFSEECKADFSQSPSSPVFNLDRFFQSNKAWRCQQCRTLQGRTLRVAPAQCEIGCPEPDWKPETLDMSLYPVIKLRDDGITIIRAASSYSFICSYTGCWDIACFAEVHNQQSTMPLYCEEHAMTVTADSDNFQLHRVECAG